MLWFSELFLKLATMDPFRQAITISSTCNKVFRTTFSKPDSVGIFLRVYCMGIANLLIIFNCWRTLKGRVNIFMPLMGEKFIRLGSLMQMLMGTAQRRMKSEYLGCFWDGCLYMPNPHKPMGKTEYPF